MKQEVFRRKWWRYSQYVIVPVLASDTIREGTQWRRNGFPAPPVPPCTSSPVFKGQDGFCVSLSFSLFHHPSKDDGINAGSLFIAILGALHTVSLQSCSTNRQRSNYWSLLVSFPEKLQRGCSERLLQLKLQFDWMRQKLPFSLE